MSELATQLKQQAAEYAVDHFFRSNSVVGLGVGSTAIFAVRHLAVKLERGELQNITAVPCSKEVEEVARKLKIPLTTLEEHPTLDTTIDGADEVDPQLNVIKGGGGALLREKIVAQSTKQEIIVVDESKLVPVLGTQWALPIEVLPFGQGAQVNFLKSLGGDPILRKRADGTTFYTDQGNVILDCNFGPMHEPYALAEALGKRAGIIEHGLFLDLVARVVVAGSTGIREIPPS